MPIRVADIAQRLLVPQNKRSLVAIAGPPASGKSTLADVLCETINALANFDCAIVLPMDGFHLDNAILDLDNTRDRKGAPHTFDFCGFHQTLLRVAKADQDVVIPTFDRSLDLARAGARRITTAHQIVLVEGNYLLLATAPWRQLFDLFDYRIFLKTPEHVLIQRLQQRWIDHGYSRDDAVAKAKYNDIPNAQLVLSNYSPADLELPDSVDLADH